LKARLWSEDPPAKKFYRGISMAWGCNGKLDINGTCERATGLKTFQISWHSARRLRPTGIGRDKKGTLACRIEGKNERHNASASIPQNHQFKTGVANTRNRKTVSASQPPDYREARKGPDGKKVTTKNPESDATKLKQTKGVAQGEREMAL